MQSGRACDFLKNLQIINEPYNSLTDNIKPDIWMNSLLKLKDTQHDGAGSPAFSHDQVGVRQHGSLSFYVAL